MTFVHEDLKNAKFTFHDFEGKMFKRNVSLQIALDDIGGFFIRIFFFDNRLSINPYRPNILDCFDCP